MIITMTRVFKTFTLLLALTYMLGAAAELSHRVDAAADPPLRFEHEHVEPRGLERQRGMQPRDACADDDDVAIYGRHRLNAPSGTDRRRRTARA